MFKRIALIATCVWSLCTVADAMSRVQPTNLVATASDRQISVAFTAPVYSITPNNLAISHYEYELDDSGTWVIVNTTSSPVVITGLTNGTTYSIKLLSRALTDEGLSNDVSMESSAVVATPQDLSAPTVTLTSTASVLSGLFTVTATFSEAVTGFEVGDITVGNGSASNFDDTAAPVYTFDVTPTADGAVTVDVAGSVAIDAAGNNNTAATQLSVTADATVPTIASTSINTANTELTVTFSESVYDTTGGTGDLEVADFALSIAGGTATLGSATPTSITKTSQTVWVLGFSTSGTANGSETITVAPASSTSIYDAAANAAATSQSNNTVTLGERVAPTVTLTGPSGVVTAAFTVTATFSEAVTGFALDDITVTNGTPSSLVTGNAPVYTFTVTPTLETTVSISIATNKVTDTAGNANTASNTFSIQAGSPASAFEASKDVVEVAVKTEVQKALTINLAADQRMLSAGMGRFVANKRSISSGQPQVNLFVPFDVDGNASYSDQKLKANGDFFALSSTNDGKSQKAVFGDFDYISDSDGNTSGYFNGRFAIETTVSDDLMLAYFAGANIGRALMDGTFKGSQNSYGLSVGGYFVRSFNDTVYVNGFASLGQSNHKLEIADDTLDLNSSYSTQTATLGGTVTGVLPQAGYEIWPELGFTYAKTKVGTMDFTGTAYGLTANNLSLDGGSVEMSNVSFAPQFKVQLSGALIEDYASTFTIAPKVTCEKVRNTTTTKGCGTGATMGLQSASDDGMTNLNVGFEYADVNNLKRRSLKLSVEHRF